MKIVKKTNMRKLGNKIANKYKNLLVSRNNNEIEILTIDRKEISQQLKNEIKNMLSNDVVIKDE